MVYSIQMVAQADHNMEFSFGVRNNVLKDVFKDGDSIVYLAIQNTCENNLIVNNIYDCVTLIRYNVQSGIYNYIQIDSFIIEGKNIITIDSSENVLVTGHNIVNDEDRSTVVLYFTKTLNFIKEHEYFGRIGFDLINQGVQLDDNYFIYGSALNYAESIELSSLIKISKTTNDKIWSKELKRGNFKNGCYSFQSSDDHNLAYIHYFSDGTGAGSDKGYQIVKLDSTGSSIDSFEFRDDNIPNPNLLFIPNDGYYFSSQNPPYSYTIPSNGRINKLSLDLDNIIWSLELPNDPFIDGRKYIIEELIKASNNDIIIGGKIWDEKVENESSTQMDYSWNAFIIRIGSDGVFKWVRIYKYLNNHPSLPDSEFGKYRFSEFNSLVEDSSGNIWAAGTVYYNSLQLEHLPDGEIESFACFVKVDSIGCIKGYPCNEIIIPSDFVNNSNLFRIGTKWTYETERNQGPIPNFISYQEFQITGLDTILDKEVYVIENSFDSSLEYMFVNGEEVYLWDDNLDDFQLTYNFSDLEQYSVNYKLLCENDSSKVAEIFIDSISSIYINNDSLVVQHISIENNGSLQKPIRTSVLKYIGLNSGGIRLPLGIGFCDFDRVITKLRCFETDEKNYNFNTYPCDSEWISTVVQETDNVKLSFSPNPTSRIINVEPFADPLNYKIYSINGTYLDFGTTYTGKIEIDNTGLFILVVWNSQYNESILVVVN